MANDIIAGMFGQDPMMMMQQRQDAIRQASYQQAQLDPFQRASASMYQGGAGLVNAGMMAAGIKPAGQQLAETRQAALANLDQDNLNSYGETAKTLFNGGDTQGAQMVMSAFRQREKEMQDLNTKQSTENLAEARMAALEKGAPIKDENIGTTDGGTPVFANKAGGSLYIWQNGAQVPFSGKLDMKADSNDKPAPLALTENGKKVVDELTAAGKPLPSGWSVPGMSRANESLNRLGDQQYGKKGTEDQGSGISLPERQAKGKAAQASLNAITKDVSALEPYKSMLDLNADIAIKLGEKIYKSDATLVNKPINWILQNMGDNPDVGEFQFQINTVRTEAARVLNNPRLVGQLTDSARKDMELVIKGDAPIKTFTRVLERVKTDGKNRLATMYDTQNKLTKQFEQPKPKEQSASGWSARIVK
jgi:hypothetical protein